MQSITHVFSLIFQEWARFQTWYHPAVPAVWHRGRNVHMEQGIETIIFKEHPET